MVSQKISLHFHPASSKSSQGGAGQKVIVAFDDLKKYGGQVYSGMSVGGTHVWEYPHGIWQEQKVAPDRWVFSFRSDKKREHKAPEGSGALPGTQYHWFIIAHQRVRKRDQDTYETVMEGVKYKVAHKRPYWRGWSTEYPDHEPEREILIRILEEQLAALKNGVPHDSRAGPAPEADPDIASIFPDNKGVHARP
jgi:hypothetical protein